MPVGVTCIDLPKKFLYQNYLAMPSAPWGTGAGPYPPDSNEAKEVAGDTVFMLKSLSGMQVSGINALNLVPGLVYLQIMYPSGRMMQNVLADSVADLGYGSGRLAFDQPIPCPAGSKFFITLDTSISGFSGGGTYGVVTAALLEGALRYFLKANGSTPPQVRSAKDSAALLPRFFFDSPNQNLMAPEWMVSGRDGEQCYPECPDGFADSPFVYSNSTVPAVFSESAPVATTIEIPIEAWADFLVRRIMFSIQASDVAPTFFIRLRTSLGGSSVTNDYMPMQTLRMHKDWFLRRGVQAYIDVFAISNGGTGNTTVYVFLEGVKRGQA
jgi:hypothetical protein